MDITIDQQVALDDALVPYAIRLRIGKSNFRLRSDLKSKESTLQVVYDVLKLTPFYKAFLVTADVPEIYMQEFWATATQFDELPFEYEILTFLRELGHNDEIKMITDVEHKDAKKNNEMYYPRFTKVIINFFMTMDQSIPRRNKYSSILPIELTNKAIRNFKSYKEYYAIASEAEPPKTKASVRKKQSRAEPPKTKASVRKKQSSSDTTMPPPTATGKRLKTSSKMGKPAKEKQPAKSSKAKGLIVLSKVALTEVEQIKLAIKRSPTQTYISQASGSGADEGTDNDGDDFVNPKFSTHDEEDKDEESFDPIVQTPSQVKNTDDEDNDKDSHAMNVEGDEGANEEDEANELYKDVNINLEGRDIQITDSSSVLSRFVLNILNPSPDTGIDSIFESTLRVDVPVMTTAELPILSATTIPLPSIPIISHVQQTPAPSPANVPSSSLQDLPNFGSLFEFDRRLKTLETKFSKFMQTNHFVEAISLILGIVDKSNEQKNLYKALVDAYECDKLILGTYGDTVTLKRRRDDEDKDEEPSAGSKRRSKRRRAGKEPKSTSAPKEKTSKTSGATDEQPVEEASQHPNWFQKQAKPPTTDRAWNKTLPSTHGRIQPWIRNLAKKADSRTSFNKLMDTPVDFSGFVMNRLKVDTLTSKLLVGRKRQHLYGFAVNRESAQDVYSKRRIIAVIELQIVEWYNYKHLDWITVRRDHDKLYKFKEGDFKRLRIQDIEDMLLLLVQGKLTNLTVDERFVFNVSLRMFTRSIVIQRRVEDLQLDKQNRLMRIDELHKFSDDTLNDVRTALDDRLKGIKMQYLPQTIWRRSGKDRAVTMIQAIDKQLKTRRIMRSLEKFDCDGIPKRPTMYINLWSYKAVRHMYLNPMIQPEPEGSTQGYLLVSVEVLRKIHTLAGNPVKDILLKLNLSDHRILKDGGEGTCFQLSQRFIAACSYPTNNYKDIMKAQVHVSRLPLL
nr:hypothetical protein [Tanacetum cinerariifolium]